MTGLLKNNFYGAFGNMKMFLVFNAVLYLALLITGNVSLMNILSMFTAPALALLAISCFRKEHSSNWGKYKLTMPVTRATIVKSQFTSHLIWTLLGVFGVSAFMAAAVLIHGNLLSAAVSLGDRTDRSSSCNQYGHVYRYCDGLDLADQLVHWNRKCFRCRILYKHGDYLDHYGYSICVILFCNNNRFQQKRILIRPGSGY